MQLTTSYLGLDLSHPIVASASPQSKELDGIIRLAEGGAAAIVLASLFEEQIHHEQEMNEHIFGQTLYSSAEALDYFPDFSTFEVGPHEYLELIRSAKRAVDVPIIASLNGSTHEGWTSYAKEMQQAGADAIELNLYFLPLDITASSQQVEDQYVKIVRSVKESVTIPVAVKLSPFFSSTGWMAKRLEDAGADGLVLFNRFYQPDFDLDRRVVESKLELSHASEARLPLLWISVLYGKVKCSLAATRGVQTGDEVVKYLMAGADAVMATSALLRNGERYIGSLKQGMEDYMTAHGYESVSQMRGCMSLQNCAEPEAFARANYIKILQSFGRVKR